MPSMEEPPVSLRVCPGLHHRANAHAPSVTARKERQKIRRWSVVARFAGLADRLQQVRMGLLIVGGTNVLQDQRRVRRAH